MDKDKIDELKKKHPGDPYASDEFIPPWDIGKVQPRIAQACEDGDIEDPVLDIGCGTGENALYIASQGYNVWGIDRAKTGIEKAVAKAEERGLDDQTEFLQADVFKLSGLDQSFTTVIDSGLLHNMDFENKLKVVDSVKQVLLPGGRYVILGFHNDVDKEIGPPDRLREEEIEEIFAENWSIEKIEKAVFLSRLPTSPHNAWYVVAQKIE